MKFEEGRLHNAIYREFKVALCIWELPQEARRRNAVNWLKDEEVLEACFWRVAVKLGLGSESFSRQSSLKTATAGCLELASKKKNSTE